MHIFEEKTTYITDLLFLNMRGNLIKLCMEITFFRENIEIKKIDVYNDY